MEDTLECPNCQMDNAYFNGITYECPECDYEWDENDSADYEEDYLDDTYLKLIKLSEPFFKFQTGTLYKCNIMHEKGEEEMVIMPLAFESNKNRLLILFQADEVMKRNPPMIKEIAKMDFDYIMYDGIENDYPNDSVSTVLCATQQDGTLIDYMGSIYSNFIIAGDINKS